MERQTLWSPEGIQSVQSYKLQIKTMEKAETKAYVIWNLMRNQEFIKVLVRRNVQNIVSKQLVDLKQN